MKKIYFQSYLADLCKKLGFEYEINKGSFARDDTCICINKKVVIHSNLNLHYLVNYIRRNIDDNDFLIFSNKFINYMNENINKFNPDISIEYLKVLNAFNTLIEKENLEKLLYKNDDVVNEVKKIKKI